MFWSGGLLAGQLSLKQHTEEELGLLAQKRCREAERARGTIGHWVRKCAELR